MIFKHEFASDDADACCKHCNARRLPPGTNDERSCVPHNSSASVLRPEPARRVRASDDYDVIRARVAELRAEALAAQNHTDNPEPIVSSITDEDYCG
jgi:hypothetical protein